MKNLFFSQVLVSTVILGSVLSPFSVNTLAQNTTVGKPSAAIAGTAGDDNLVVSNTVPHTIYGYDGNDKITGGVANDKIYGGKGDDTIFGLDGDDTVFGDLGGDLIMGNRGNDILLGGEGNDSIFGGQGLDRIYGGKGNDKIYSDLDGAWVWGDDGTDEIYITPTNDRTSSAFKYSYVDTGKGADRIFIESRGVKNGDQIYIYNPHEEADDIFLESDYTVVRNVEYNQSGKKWRILLLNANGARVQVAILGNSQVSNDNFKSSQIQYVPATQNENTMVQQAMQGETIPQASPQVTAITLPQVEVLNR
jgi:Ca2+-binding RTX toxin-like protein